MLTLIGYELRKLLTRRFLWLTAAVAVVFIVNVSAFMIRARQSGYVQGMRDVYARYEGSVLTDVVKAQVQTEFNAYVARHPDEFTIHYDEESGEDRYSSQAGYSYAAGLLSASTRIIHGWTVEDEVARREQMAHSLETGLDENGSPLSEQIRESYVSYLENEFKPRTIVYAEGYAMYFLYTPQTPSIMVLLLLAVALHPLFTAERASRMESIMLSTAKRKQAAAAKMAAAFILGLTIYGLCFGIQWLMVDLSYGFAGFNAPESILHARWFGNTAGRILLIYQGITLAASLAWMGIMAWMSAASRNSLLALLAGFVAAIVQIIPANINSPMGITASWILDAGKLFRKVVSLLPAPVLYQGHLFWYIVEANTSTLALGLSAAILTLALVFAPRCWLSQRKV